MPRYDHQPWIATNWLSSNVFTYIKVRDAGDAEAIMDAFPAFLDRVVDKAVTPGFDESPNEVVRFSMLPVADVHLYSEGRFQMKASGDLSLIHI